MPNGRTVRAVRFVAPQLSLSLQLSCTFALPFTETSMDAKAFADTCPAAATHAADFALRLDWVFANDVAASPMSFSAFCTMGPSVRAAKTSLGKFASTASFRIETLAETRTSASNVTFGGVHWTCDRARLLQLTAQWVSA